MPIVSNVVQRTSGPSVESLSQQLTTLRAEVAALRSILGEIKRPDGSLEFRSPRRAEIDVGGSTKIVVDGIRVTVKSATDIVLEAPGAVTLNASTVRVNTPMAVYSGTVRCETIIATNVVGSSYTPGAGNVM